MEEVREFLNIVTEKNILAGIIALLGGVAGIYVARGKSVPKEVSDPVSMPSQSAQIAGALTELLAYARSNDHQMKEVRGRVESVNEACIRNSVTLIEINDELRSDRRHRRRDD